MAKKKTTATDTSDRTPTRKTARPARKKPRKTKHMVIVESPAKAKTINKYLGSKYVVMASMGHVRDLPKNRLGVDLENGYEPHYQTIRGKGMTLQDLRKALKRVDKVFLAPDPDREGEAIAWHLIQALKIPEEKALRIQFNEITPKAVAEAIANPGTINIDRVNAQQARRILDRIVGYKLSPLLWEKIAKGLSAGRVQSVAVKLIVEREKEIQEFEPEEYWRIRVQATPVGEDGPDPDKAFDLEVKEVDGEAVRLGNEAEARAVVDRIENAALVINTVQTRMRRENPSPPFTTSTLQQSASTRLRFSARKTMMVAQQLYEGVEAGDEGSVGLITYMRTDSFRVAGEAAEASRNLIGNLFDKDYLPEEPPVYGKRKGAQEAHEAIRPTDPVRTPQDLKSCLTQDQFKLYNLIWERFMASQMTPARYATTEVRLDAGGILLTARGRVMEFDGFTRILSGREDPQDALPSGLEEGLELERLETDPTQHFTEPPPRYSEASLVKTLEKKGIGRPSTYAAILSTISDRGYVKFKDRKFTATELGILVTEKLCTHFPKVLDAGFTSRMEQELDRIAGSEADWIQVLDEFYLLFRQNLEAAYENMEDLKKNPEVSEKVCEKCGKNFIVKFHKRGKFLACSGYPDCKNTRSMDGVPKQPPEPTGLECEKCGAPLVIRNGRRGRFIACSAYPKCRNTKSCDEAGKPIEPEKTGEDCEKCGAPMVIRIGRRGRFAACSAYPKCRNTKTIKGEAEKPPEKTGETCEECGAGMVIRYGRRGAFQACSAYPRCKHTRSVETQPQEQTA